MKVQNADIVIIGAGAAGLMAAAGAGITSPDKKIVVLEKMPRPARKIMITGKGRCNFTNAKPWNEFSRHIHPKANFLKPSFYSLTSEGMIDFLEKHGLATVVERGDRAYPESRLASDVIDTLVRAAQRAGAEIFSQQLFGLGDVVFGDGIKDFQILIGVATQDTQSGSYIDTLQTAGIGDGDTHNILHNITAAVNGTMLRHCVQHFPGFGGSVSDGDGFGATHGGDQLFFQNAVVGLHNFLIHNSAPFLYLPSLYIHMAENTILFPFSP